MKNICCICGGEIPNGYTVHQECTTKTSLKFESRVIYTGSPFFKCKTCGTLLKHSPNRKLDECEKCRQKSYKKERKPTQDTIAHGVLCRFNKKTKQDQQDTGANIIKTMEDINQ